MAKTFYHYSPNIEKLIKSSKMYNNIMYKKIKFYCKKNNVKN